MAELELTEREREVATLIALGEQTKQIAHALHISSKTVECHRTNIRHKLGVLGTAGIVLWAVRHGLVQV